MAITKRFKVTFEVTAVIDSENEEAMREHVLQIAKDINAGKDVEPFKKQVLIHALTYGPDGAAAFTLKEGLRELVKDAHRNLCRTEREMLRFSPAKVEILQ